MKTSLSILLCLTAIVFSYSCSKENNSHTEKPVSTSHLVRIQQGTDPDLNNDTVYLISYDDSNRIISLVDSINQDTMFVTCNAAGNPLTIQETYGFTASFIYDGNGTLTQLDYVLAGSHEQDVFEYTGGILSKRTHNSNLGSGPVHLVGSYTYTFSGGNITDRKEYDLNGNLVQEILCQYTTHSNDFKNISLLNLGNLLGADSFLSFETYFNQNMIAGFSINAMSATNTYTQNAAKQITQNVTAGNIYGGAFTWYFSYK